MEGSGGMGERRGSGEEGAIKQCTSNETSAVVYLVLCDGLQQSLSVRVDGKTLARLGEGVTSPFKHNKNVTNNVCHSHLFNAHSSSLLLRQTLIFLEVENET